MYFPRFLSIFIYFLFIHVFWLVLKCLYYSDIFQVQEPSRSSYDYIIVGSGSAGSIVAKRLAQEAGINVLLLEAGANPWGLNFLQIPSIGLMLQQTWFDWSFKTVPQSHSCRSLNNFQSFWPAGRLVGGTSMLNNMIYVRGHREDYEEWFQGLAEFNFDLDIKPYFKKVELSSIKLAGLNFKTDLSKNFLLASQELNSKVFQNNLDCNLGFSEPSVSLYEGRRSVSFNSLQGEKNLEILSRSTVKKLLFSSENNLHVKGVEVEVSGRNIEIWSKLGVILSAGTINSPKILLNSGIGPEEHLKDLKLDFKLDLPVGNNLQDHLTTGLDLVLLNQSLELDYKKMISLWSFFEYFYSGQGPWTTVGCEGLAFLNTLNDSRPNLQLMAMPLSISNDEGIFLQKLVNLNLLSWKNFFEKTWDSNPISILPVLLHPKSKGTIRLSRTNPLEDSPEINPNYLQSNEDLKVILQGIETVKKLVKSKYLNAKLNPVKYPGCEDLTFDTEEYWTCYVRHVSLTTYHPVGTCKMGQEDDVNSVVDYNFKVLKTENVWVVDGSVLPSLPSGNTMGPIMILAEYASDKIKFWRYLQTEKCQNWEIFKEKMFCQR